MTEERSGGERVELNRLLRKLPAVGEILAWDAVQKSLDESPRWAVVKAVRAVLQIERERLLGEGDPEGVSDEDALRGRIEKMVVARVGQVEKPSLKRVVNGSGVIIHTNLGRSPLSKAAIDAISTVAGAYSNLEYDLTADKRGNRYDHVRDILCQVTAAEDALVVNNNAAAVLLCLNTIASGREVIVSRGELVEIGGSFRMPDVMRASGAVLVEVGTTNRTRLDDYMKAVTERTALLLKVHTSNYKICGFTESVPPDALVALGRDKGIPVMDDLGSGCMVDCTDIGLGREPKVTDSVGTGADVVCVSGDKLLGGPQAGIILGKKEWTERIAANPINRALRIDKMTLAALEMTLRSYLDGRACWREIPVLRMLSAPLDEIERKGRSLAAELVEVCGKEIDVAVEDARTMVGGGSLPMQSLPTRVVALRPKTSSLTDLVRRLHESDPPVIGRIEEASFLLDCRTLSEEDLDDIVEVFREIVGSESEGS